MKIAIQISVAALLVALATTASAKLAVPTQRLCGGEPTLLNPDQSDCAFCGGNPAVHIRSLVNLERANMAVFTVIAR